MLSKLESRFPANFWLCKYCPLSVLADKFCYFLRKQANEYEMRAIQRKSFHRYVQKMRKEEIILLFVTFDLLFVCTDYI